MKLRSVLRRGLRLQHPLTQILYLPTRRTLLTFAVMIGVLSATAALGQDTAASAGVPEKVQVVLNTLWVIFAGVLVFFMNAGFAMLETGFCRAKNAVNLLSKNLIVFALSSISYWAIGFALMFGDGNGVLGTSGFFLLGADNSPATGTAYQGVYDALSWAAVPLSAKFFFQLVFAGTAATIVSGAVAERIKFYAFFIFSLLLVGISYPITGHWIWGGGWLQQLGMWDFAGSTVVHSVGGWAALMGAALLGPRLGRFLPDGSVAAIPGHNFAIATLGCLILWLGWFGFNPGSTMAADPGAIAHIVVTTNMSAAFGGVTATIVSSRYFGKPDLSMIINGILAGLVAITAPCAFVSIGSAVLI
ncbi:ammonium transporter, partial [Thermosynechococcus sp.]|uniref:ammonium transporter n=1 Tax=Thermosynechococcus sp. TaxID=2814275 RepID=UPI00391BD523